MSRPYDVLGRLKQIDVKKGDNGTQTQTRTFVYDDYGRLQTETTPEAGAVQYSYTTNDQLATKTDARGKVTTLAYNTANLLTSVSYNDSTPGATYGYDEFGARTSMTDGEGTMSYVFDANRRLQSETRTFTGLTNQTFTLTYSYSLGGQLKLVNYGSSAGLNKNVNYAYNSVGALTGVGTNLIGSDPNATTNVLSGISYNGFGAVKTLNYGNGRRLTLTYDVNRHQMQTMKVDNQNGTGTIINKTYSYTSQKWDEVNQTWMDVNDGRIQKITDLVDGAYTTTYAYDPYNRLTSASSTAANRSYTYNEWGNLKTVVSNGATKTYNYTNNASGAPATNRINTVTGGGTVSYTWDAAGNMTGEGATTFQYDAAERMVSVNSGTGGSYGFDGDGKRVKKTEGGVTVYYVESSVFSGTVLEVNQSALLQRAYVVGTGGVVAQLASDGQFYWRHRDDYSNSSKLTNASGVVVYRGEFDPHGNAVLETGTSSLLSQKYGTYGRDASGFDYAQARTYTSNRGRFTSPDPLGIRSAKFSQPQSLNRYSYVQNDPINFKDPGGLNRCPKDYVRADGTLVIVTCTGSSDGSGGGSSNDQIEIEDNGKIGDQGESGESEPVGEMWVDRAKKVAQSIKEKILNSKNSCSDFLGANAEAALNDLVSRLTQKGDFSGGQTSNTGITQTYKTPYTFVTNANGQKIYRVPDIAVIIENGPFTQKGKIGFGGYGPGAGGTQIIALLHEIAHNLVAPGSNGDKFLIPNDGGDTKLSEANTKQILDHCKDQIFGAIGGL